MNRIPNIEIVQQLNWLLTALIFLLLTGLAWYIYRRTNPIVPPAIKHLLTFLRWAALILLMWIILEPIIRFIFFQNEPATIAVLVDNSASMSLEDNGVRRTDKVREFLTGPVFKTLSQQYQVEVWPFSTRLADAKITERDSIQFDGSGTDIHTALEQLAGAMAEKYWTATVLLSDGVYNTGANPVHYASEIGHPIYPIAIGDPAAKKDLLLVEVLANEVTYVDNQSPVSVRIRNIGYENLRTTVNLKQGSAIIASQEVQFSSAPADKVLQLQFTPKQEGIQKYSVEIRNQVDEATTKNNAQVFYTNVLKSKIKIVLFAGAPSSDLAFFSRVVNAEENLEARMYVEKSDGSFYLNPGMSDLAEADIFCFVNFPTSQSSHQILTQLVQVCQQKARPIFLLAGNRIDNERLQRFYDFLPVNGRLLAKNFNLVTIQTASIRSDHPILAFVNNPAENIGLLQQLPPVFQNFLANNLWPDAQVLLIADEAQSLNARNRSPVLAVRQFGKQKSVAVFAHQLWRWDLMMWGIGKDNKSYARLITHSIKWLASGNDEKRVRISTNKQKYHNREEISLSAQVYSEDFRPAADANVTAVIQKEDKTTQVTFKPVGDGFYQAVATVLEPGDYLCSLKAEKAGGLLGMDTTRFTVGEFNLEMQDVRMNAELLQNLAQNSGGKFLTISETNSLLNELKFPDRKIELNSELELFNNKLLLLLILGFLSIEWFLRKRKGMV